MTCTNHCSQYKHDQEVEKWRQLLVTRCYSTALLSSRPYSSSCSPYASASPVATSPIPATVGEQCNRPHRCRQPKESESSCSAPPAQRGTEESLLQEKGYLWLRVSRLSTLDLKKMGKYAGKNKIICSLKSWKHEQVHHNRLNSFTNEVHHKVPRKKPSKLTCTAWKAPSELIKNKDLWVHRARVKIINLYQLSPKIFLKRRCFDRFRTKRKSI